MSDFTKVLVTSTFVKLGAVVFRDSHSSPQTGSYVHCGASLTPRFTFFLQTGSYVHLGARRHRDARLTPDGSFASRAGARAEIHETCRAAALPSRQLMFACPSYSPPTSNPNSAAAGSGGVCSTRTIAFGGVGSGGGATGRDGGSAGRSVSPGSTPRRSSKFRPADLARPPPPACRLAPVLLAPPSLPPVLITPPRLSAVRPAPLRPPSFSRARPPRPPVLARVRAPPIVAARLDPRSTLAAGRLVAGLPGRLIVARDQRRRVRARQPRLGRREARPGHHRGDEKHDGGRPNDVLPPHATTHARGRQRGPPVRPALLPSAAAWPPKHPSTT